MSELVLSEQTEAYELWRPPELRTPLILTCEHASERLPSEWTWSPRDERLRGSHWALDLGARQATLDLGARLGADVVMARFTRLLIDANRPLDADTLFRTHADGLPIDLNADLDQGEAERRIQRYYEPFHRAVDQVMAQRASLRIVVSIHSFTPLYEGVPRDVEVGVLFDENPDLGEAVFASLSDSPYDLRRNEPWTGRGGLMYSPQSHATRHGIPAVELELRQDLVTQQPWRQQAIERIGAALSRACEEF